VGVQRTISSTLEGERKGICTFCAEKKRSVVVLPEARSLFAKNESAAGGDGWNLVTGPTVIGQAGSTIMLVTESTPLVSTTKTSSEIPLTLAWWTNGTALIATLLFSGIVFGWAPLQLLLRSEGQYVAECLDQESCVTDHYHAIFTVAQFLLSFASLPAGFLVDILPVHVHWATVLVWLVSGLSILSQAQSSSSSTIDWLLISYAFLALAGCGTMLGSFPATFLLPRYQPALLAAISCLFDASSIVFAIFDSLYNYDHDVYSRAHLMGVYAVVALVVVGFLIYCWSRLEQLDWKARVTTKTEENPQENENTTTTTTTRLERLHAQPVLAQVTSLEFVLALVFAGIQMLRCNYYIMSVNDLLHAYGDDDDVYTRLFSYILPCGIVFVPIIERTLHVVGVINTLHVTNVLGVIFGLLLLVPSLPVQAVNFIVFTAFRAYLYATLNNFTAQCFGVRTMGRMIGCIFTCASLVTLVQYPAAAYAMEYDAFVTVLVGLVAASGLPIVLTIVYSRME